MDSEPAGPDEISVAVVSPVESPATVTRLVCLIFCSLDVDASLSGRFLLLDASFELTQSGTEEFFPFGGELLPLFTTAV